ncbi:hypothetical protein PHYBLDRAFT_161484 [Phycomyces blakesleeanus NRRL 1555(-)]|uniref:Uncharacterized protein n=1 Tax=Phycomyces blakesleeanus (strain ATCC 8743b / DSM 1359 / FGSC 10004 / NBRC 33097 / NRRL 1555) TaxID=763407 RepID=A0A162Q7Y8_PHYB8|nr:hypothetical protein PHYBLDRAFT_161484 [Phycomyces blakesleeanus NRRL 1555(-)]OAD80846.1 hypothetical protein PHYBLDRAFT_161484 [Phycomyces blakesleeanus NRRL 1555(-)]|eukprot:XP_018298886.1 hypothetical protein PHYBLDRAFT_161484 [Phycomyces blakesleeanus NRRL 1555(-)]
MVVSSKLGIELLWWLKLKKFLRGRIEDLRLETKICEKLCRFCLLRKDFVSKFDQVPTLNYYCYLYYFGSGKLYDWGQFNNLIFNIDEIVKENLGNNISQLLDRNLASLSEKLVPNDVMLCFPLWTLRDGP